MKFRKRRCKRRGEMFTTVTLIQTMKTAMIIPTTGFKKVLKALILSTPS